MIHLLLLMLPLLQIPGVPTGLLPGAAAGLRASVRADSQHDKSKEPWYCPISNQVTKQWESWLPVMIIVTLISFFLAAVIFMVGVALESVRIRNYGAAEFYEAIATAIIVVAFVYICAVLFGLGPGLLRRRDKPLCDRLQPDGLHDSKRAEHVQLASTTSTSPLSGTTSVSVTIGGPLAGTSQDRSVTSDLACHGRSRDRLRRRLLQLLHNGPVPRSRGRALAAALRGDGGPLRASTTCWCSSRWRPYRVFLIPGVIFRALLPTRGLGGVMIAMAIGFYLVMPDPLRHGILLHRPRGDTGREHRPTRRCRRWRSAARSITSPQSPAVQYLNQLAVGAQRLLDARALLPGHDHSLHLLVHRGDIEAHRRNLQGDQ